MTEMSDELKRKRLRYLQLKAKASQAQEASAADEPVPMPVISEPDPDVGRAEALGHGAVQGATLGFAPEIGGFQRAAQQFVQSHLPKAVQEWAEKSNYPFWTGTIKDSEGKDVPALDVYRDARDSNERNEKRIKDARPYWYGTGEVAGGMLVPAGGAGSLKGAVKAGMVAGAASGVGNSNADLTRGEVGGALLDTAAGGAGGAVGGGLGHGVARAGGFLAKALGKKLEDVGIAQGRRVLLNGADSLSSRKELAADAVKEALDSGAIKPFGTTQGAYERLQREAGHWGEVYSAAVEKLESLGVRGPQAEAMARKFANEAADLADNTLGSNAPALFEGLAQEVAEKSTDDAGRLGLSQAEAIKQSLQEGARKEYERVGGDTILGNAKKRAAALMRQANEDAIESAAQNAPGSEIAEVAESFVPVKQKLGRLLNARDAARRGASRASQRASGNGIGKMELVGALASGNPAALAAGPIGGFVKNRGTSAVAAGTYNAGKLVKALGKAVDRNPIKAVEAGTRVGGAVGRDAILPIIEITPGGYRILPADEEEKERQRAIIEALRKRGESR